MYIEHETKYKNANSIITKIRCDMLVIAIINLVKSVNLPKIGLKRS